MADLEKGHQSASEDNSNQLDGNIDTDAALRRIKTAGSLSISPELFEKIYLSPKNQVTNNLRTTFGNPTPLAIAGFIMSLTPLSNVLLEWRGSGGLGAAETGAYFFFGGMLMTIGGLLEFILGNTYPFVVFASYGAYWLTAGATYIPAFNASGAYRPDNPSLGSSDPVFLSSYAFFDLWMAVLSFIFLICALRTNFIYVMIFVTLCPMYCTLAGSYWHAAQGNAATALALQHAGGALAFISCLLGWYLFLALCLTSVDFPLNLPVGDLSRLIKGGSETGRRRLALVVQR